jgi:uncharacterized DUF497 family protein
MFDWDEANIAHIALHGVAPNEVEEAIRDPFCALESSEERHGQIRYKVVGETLDGRVLQAVFEIRHNRVRPVTAHTAPKKKQAEYWARRKHDN